MEKGDPALAIQYAVCHGALAMTTPGDTTMARKEEVEALMKGAGAECFDRISEAWRRNLRGIKKELQYN